MKNILNKAKTAVQARLLPYWDLDPEFMGADGEIGPFMKIKATFKNNDRDMDIRVETRQGEEMIKDFSMGLIWAKMLRQTKMSHLIKWSLQSEIHSKLLETKTRLGAFIYFYLRRYDKRSRDY